MDIIRSWLFRDKERSERIEGATKDGGRNETDLTTVGQDQVVAATSKSIEIDPKVAEYFRDFPEPYKTKAIARFSSREGMYKWNIIRDFDMRREYESAARGQFLEDQREAYEAIQRREQSYLETVKRENQEKEREVDTREMSALEKAIRSKIYVHEDDSLGLKLFQTVNFSVLGFITVWYSIRLKKRKPTVSKVRHYSVVGGSIIVCYYLQMAAVYRLMDWGTFNRTVDNRDPVTKEIEELKQFLLSLPDYVTESKSKRKDES